MKVFGELFGRRVTTSRVGAHCLQNNVVEIGVELGLSLMLAWSSRRTCVDILQEFANRLALEREWGCLSE